MPEWLLKVWNWLKEKFSAKPKTSVEQSSSGNYSQNIQGTAGDVTVNITPPTPEPAEEPLTEFERELLEAARDHQGKLYLDEGHTKRSYPCVAFQGMEGGGFGAHDPETAAHYTGALDSLEARGLVENSSGIAYRLTDAGWTVSRTL